MGRRRRRLPDRARRGHRRRRPRLVPGGPAGGRRAPAGRRVRAPRPGGRLRERAVRALARDPGRMAGGSGPLGRDAATRCPLQRRDGHRCSSRAGRRRTAALRRRLVRPGLLGVRRGAVRGGAAAGDARGRAGAAARWPVGVRGEPPHALDVLRRPGPGRADGRPSRTSTARPTSRSTPTGVPTYVEHHRTLGDRVRDVVAAGLVLDDLVEPEWPPGRETVWGQWSPLRGALFPGTAIFVCRRPAT